MNILARMIKLARCLSSSQQHPITPHLESQEELNRRWEIAPQAEFATPTIEVPKVTRSYKSGGLRQRFTIWAAKHYQQDPDLIRAVIPLRFPFSKYCIKYSLSGSLNEAVALRFVASKTSVPVPKVYCAFEHIGFKNILMERVKGCSIKEGWSERSEDGRNALLEQLKGFFEELRNIPHPHPGAVGAADMQELFDPRLAKGDWGFGSFANERDFHTYVRAGFHEDNPSLNDPSESPMTKEEQE